MKRTSAIILIAVIIVVIMSLMLLVSDRTGDDAFASSRFRVVDYHRSILARELVVVDTETNVLYLFVKYGYGAGITPLLDSDGAVQFLNEP